MIQEFDETIKKRSWKDMTTRDTKWLAPGWLQDETVNVLFGAEGIGKSLFWVHVAASLSKGEALPEVKLPRGNPQTVGVIVTEDTQGKVRERFVTAGGDEEFVWTFSDEEGANTAVIGYDRNGVMTDDLIQLHENLEDGQTKLLVVDGFLDTIPSHLNIKDTQQARLALKPWKELARSYDLAVLLLAHSNRIAGSDLRNAMGGSVALRQVARSVIFAHATDKERSHRLWVGPEKSNSSALFPAVCYKLDKIQVREPTKTDPGEVARLAAPVMGDAPISELYKDWSAEAAKKPSDHGNKRERVSEAIIAYLGSHDAPYSTGTIKSHVAEAEGASENYVSITLNRMGTSQQKGRVNGKPNWVYLPNGDTLDEAEKYRSLKETD